jgi:hypothetical protein
MPAITLRSSITSTGILLQTEIPTLPSQARHLSRACPAKQLHQLRKPVSPSYLEVFQSIPSHRSDSPMTDRGCPRANVGQSTHFGAELRNQIYGYLEQQPCSIRICPENAESRNSDLPRNAPATAANWPFLKRKTLGLSQTCRQVRTEYLPLLQQSHGRGRHTRS